MRIILLTFVINLFLSCSCQKKSEVDYSHSMFRGDTYTEARADSNYEANNFGEAIRVYTELLKKDSLNPKYRYRRGYSYGKLADFEKSSLDLKISIGLGYRLADSYYLLGIYQIPLLNDSLGIIYLEQSLKFRPNSKYTKEALAAFKKHRRLKPIKTR